MLRSMILTVLLLALAGPAQADLSYTFLELNGFWQSSLVEFKDPVTGRNISGDEGGVMLEGSLAVHKYIHLFGGYQWGTTVSTERLLGIGRLELDTEFGAFGGGLNHRLMGDRGSVFAQFGFLFGVTDPNLGFGDQDEYGFLFRAGLRYMPRWEPLDDRLELFFTSQVSNQNLVDNVIAFDIGSRYDLTNWLALSFAVQAGTDSFVGVTGGLRFYWWQLVQQLRGKDPKQDFHWIDRKTSPSRPDAGGATSGGAT